jgi:hypothetical protein
MCVFFINNHIIREKYMNIKNLFLILVMVFAMSSCTTKNERKAAETLRNIQNITLAVKQDPSKVTPAEGIAVIELAAGAAANNIDPKNEAPATVTVEQIINNKKEAFKKIIIDASTVPPSDWGWLATVGSGILIAAGFVGRAMGPPWNIAGMASEALGRKLVPHYEETKQAAIGMIAATESVLEQYGDLLDTMPETKKVLQEKLGGQDPVEWFKSQLQKAHTDLGTQPAVKQIMDLMKTHLTTEDGVITPAVEEFDKFISKGFSRLK